MRRQPYTIKHPTQNAALLRYRRCRQQRWYIGQQRRSRAQIDFLDKRRHQRGHQFLNRSHLRSIFRFHHQPIAIQTRQALFARLQVPALVRLCSMRMQQRLCLANDFSAPLRRQSQQLHDVEHLRLDLIGPHAWSFTGQPIVSRASIISIPATVFRRGLVVGHAAVAVLAVHQLGQHPTALRLASQTDLAVFGRMVRYDRPHFVPDVFVDQRRMNSWQKLIIEFDEATIDRILENDFQIPFVVQTAALCLNIVDPPTASIQFPRNRQIRVTPGRIQLKCEPYCFRIRAWLQDTISTFLITYRRGTMPAPLLDFLLNAHHDFAAKLVAEPFGEHALHLKVYNALWCAGVNIIIEADQTDTECIEFCFHIELQAQIAHKAVEIHDDQGTNSDALLLDVVQQALKRWPPIVASTDAFLDIDAGDIEAALGTERATLPFLCFKAVALNLRLIGDSNVNSNKHWKPLRTFNGGSISDRSIERRIRCVPGALTSDGDDRCGQRCDQLVSVPVMFWRMDDDRRPCSLHGGLVI